MKEEWKNIRNSSWIKIVLAAIIAIPMLYAGIFLGSMWDPYGNTDKMPVAVVNEDQTVVYQGKMLHIGDDLTDNLMKTKEMDFHVVNAKQAKQGLQDGSYYMVITIPKDFSQHATTLLQKNPEKMELTYTTNPGTNYIASKMDETAISKIRQQVSETVTKTYADTLFFDMTSLSDGLKTAGDGSAQIQNGLMESVDGNQRITVNLQTLASSSLTFSNGSETFEQGLQSYTDGVAQLQQGAQQLHDGMQTMQEKSGSLGIGTTSLQQGSASILQGVQAYTEGVNALTEGSTQLTQNSQALTQGMDTLAEGTSKLYQGSTRLMQGLQALSFQLRQSDEANAAALQMLHTQNTSSTADIRQLSASVSVMHQQLEATIQKNTASSEQLDNIADQLEVNGAAADSIQTIREVSASMKEETLTYQSLQNSLSAFAAQSNQLGDLLYGNDAALTSLQQGIATVQQSLDAQGMTLDRMGLIQGMQQLQSSLSLMEASLTKEQGLQQGVSAYTDGVNTLQMGLSQLSSQSSSLVQGADDLYKGTTTLKDATPVLQNGITQLLQGTNQLQEGTTALNSNSNALLQGAEQLKGGAVQISQGANQLAQGSNTLGNGLQQLRAGTTTLTSSLKQGAEESDMSATQKTTDMLASPVVTNHQEISNVENNGTAMAPYMMSVGLYVACMAFTLMYPLLKNTSQTRSGFRLWLSKASVMYAVSTWMAVVMVAALVLINGMAPYQMLETFAMAVLIAAAFMSMIVFLSITCGKIGSFLILVFMVLQLGGAAGTYPLETSSAFYNAIHPFMPFSYSVHAFRNTLAIGGSLTTDVLVFALILLIFSLLSILFYRWKARISEEAFEKTPIAKLHEV